MPALRIDLDDQATDGLEELNAKLEEMAIASQNAADGTDILTEAQQRQVLVLHEQRTGWSTLADTSIDALARIGDAGARAYSATAQAAGAATLATSAFASSTVLSMGIVTASAIKATGAMAGLARMGTNLATGTAGLVANKMAWDKMGDAAQFAGITALKAASGFGPQILGATIAVESYRAVLARTGLKTVELADGTKVLESNLDRVNQAAGKFGGDISRDMSMAAEGMKDLLNVVIPFPDIWKEVDKIATKSAENLISNIGMLQQGYNDATMASESWVRQLLGEEASAIRKSIELRREQYAIDKEAAAKKAAEAPFQERLNQVNAEAAARAEARGEAERIASLKTVQAVDAEIKKVHERMESQKTSLRFTAEEAMKSNNQLIALERQREVAEKAASTKRSEYHKKRTEEYTEEMKAVDALISRQREVYDLEVSRARARAGFQKELLSTQKDETVQSVMAAAEAQHEQDKERVAARLKAQGVTETQIKSQLAELDQQFAATAHSVKMQMIADEFKIRRNELDRERLELEKSGINGIEREKRLSKIKAEEDKAIFEARKKAIAEQGNLERTQNTITANQRRAEQQAYIAAEEERRARAKADRDEALKKAFPTQDILNSTDPQKVLEQLRADRATREQQAQAERDSALGQQAMSGDKKAISQWNRNQRAAINRGKNSANRDFENGNVGESEFQQAQAEVALQSLAGLQQQGRISQQVAIGLAETLNAVTAEAAKNAALQQQVERLVAAAKGISQGAKRANDSYRSQMGSLN
ncbi:hypothetical protein [Schlesneria sp. T3-172]|uniref:hypothetical protein n=1 Tax=Schlesneria sphaerica TaxID=3373610 RepID=UPI0037C8E6F5